MKRIFTLLLPVLFFFSGRAQTSNINETDNIATFCKVWGFLKYYHPVVAKGKFDWDKEFIARVNKVSVLKSKEEISGFYSEWISSLGEVKHCRKCNRKSRNSFYKNLDLSWLNDTTHFTASLIRTLQFIVKNRNRGESYYVQPIEGIGNVRFDNEKIYKDSIFPTPELRLLALSRYWNIVNYFFPYKYQMDLAWDSVLLEAVPKIKYADDTLSYHLAMLETTVEIDDSHSIFFTGITNRYFGIKWVPFRYKIMKGKAVVIDLLNDSLCKKDDVQIGDVFLNVNGVNIDEIVKERYKYISGSNEVTRLRNFYCAVFNGSINTVITTFERNGEVKKKILHRYPLKEIDFNMNGASIKERYKILDGNIGYVNMGLLDTNDVKGMTEKLRNTKAIIFDVRNYPKGTYYQIVGFLNATWHPFVKITVPDLNYPGVFRWEKELYCGYKNKNPYKGKVVLLFNELTQSHAEFTLMALETAPDVIKIGSQTSGADGNICMIPLPGDFVARMSGIGIFYPDGRETQRVGIVPDIIVEPTIEGIKAGRDEVLEKALSVLSE